jgi:hypothetical protein
VAMHQAGHMLCGRIIFIELVRLPLMLLYLLCCVTAIKVSLSQYVYLFQLSCLPIVILPKHLPVCLRVFTTLRCSDDGLPSESCSQLQGFVDFSIEGYCPIWLYLCFKVGTFVDLF